jgi:hypothetical protein
MPPRKYSKNTKKNKNKNRKNNKNKRSNANSSASSSSTPASGLSTPLSGQSTPLIEEVAVQSVAQLTVMDAPVKGAPVQSEEPAPVSTPELVFMDLTCDRELEYDLYEQHLSPSTHDLAELMLYSFVDSSPYVADLIYSKQLLKQGEFLTLTDEKDWADMPTIEFSTHEPYY